MRTLSSARSFTIAIGCGGQVERVFSKDDICTLIPTTHAFAERSGPIDHWTEMPRGGHFGEWEEPELLADDIRTFFAAHA